MPRYGYVCEYEKLKEIAVAHQMETDAGKQDLEMVLAEVGGRRSYSNSAAKKYSLVLVDIWTSATTKST